jgi:hypothetical protein
MSESGAVQFEDYLGQLDLWPDFKLLDNDIDGRIPVCKVEHWRDFERCVREDDASASAQMIYRGHRRHDWALAATLTRRFDDGAIPADVRDTLYRKFKLAMRGRGVDLAKLDDDREVWAYGQHFGLATPLLDWTESPFVALFFAFTEPDPEDESRNDWLGRAIRDRRILEEEKRRQAAEAARPRVDVHEIAEDTGADVELVKAFLEASLTDEEKKAADVADWAVKVDARYRELKAVDWPNRPNAVLKLRTEFRRLLAVLGWPEISRDEIAAKLVDFYKERIGAQPTP